MPHARWGAIFTRRLKNEEVSFAIDGHHAGLPDYTTWQLEHTVLANEEIQQLTTLYEDLKKDLTLTDNDIKQFCIPSQCASHEKDIHTRFLFSCLTDADWLDTEEHFSPHVRALRRTQSLQDILNSAIEKVDAELQALASTSSPINELRTRARLDALQKADFSQGFFSLNLPTGLGKTLTSFRWALEHAKKHMLQRIIIVLPYTNIIDQTAQKLTSILGAKSILEHHASYIFTEHINKEQSIKKLATENWDYPIVITTSVQFFETLSLDAVNCLLSFLYTLLTHDIRSALECVGLDPAVGFLHRDRPGRPSLALDLMEEFRPYLADRLACTLINREQVKAKGFQKTESGAVIMNDETRKEVLTAWQERKKDVIEHPFLQEKVPVGLLCQMQARLLARYIRGDIDAYPPFTIR